MKLTLAEPKYIKDSITIISELVNEGRFKVSKDSLELVAMDPANVAMVIFRLFSSAFTEYDLKDTVEFGINLSNLKQILRRAGPNDMLTLELDEENKLKVELKGGIKRTFSLPIIELEEKEQKVPDLQFPVQITTASGILSDAIDDVDIVADSVSFSAEPEMFSISAQGDLSQAKIDIKAAESTFISMKSAEKVRSKYSIEYLKKMAMGCKLSDEVTIMFNKDYPLKLEYKAIDRLLLSFILAPRVEND